VRSLSLVLTLCLLVGCGSPTAARFGPDYEEAFAPASGAVEQLDAAWDDPTAARDVARRFDEAAGRLRDLEAPSGAQDELDAVASAVAKLADNFASAADHYPAEDWVLDAVEVNAERLLDANQALQAAIERL
jgi:hypothetical protein